MKDHKFLEHQAYESLYSEDAEFVSSDIREGLLHESEDFFCQRLQALSKDAKVLEIGCGTGKHSILAAKSGAKIILATDIAKAAIDAASKCVASAGVAERVKFQVLDIESPGDFNDEFDLIINHEVFSSIDLQKALPNLRRFLRPGGTILSIECLNGNPIFNLNRRVSVLRGRRTAWSASHILSFGDLERIKEYFPEIQVFYFHLFTIFAAPFWLSVVRRWGMPVVNAARKIDRKVLNSTGLRQLAFKVVVEAR